MSKRWTESELRFIKDNAQKMSVQSLADSLSVRIDELEKRMEKLGLAGATGTPAAKKALTMKELSRHTENARKDFDRGVAALQKKKFEIGGIHKALLEAGPYRPRSLGERIVRAVERHAAGCNQHDDITLVCFGRTN